MNKDSEQAQAAQESSQPRRRGRPPGSKTKKKVASSKPARKGRRGGRRPGKRGKRSPASAPVVSRVYACFIDEEGGLQLAPLSGEGESITLSRADALAVAAFVERHRVTLTNA